MPRQDAQTKPRRGPKWHARRRAIIDTSAAVFAQRGYHATGINELCKANELGKGGLYHYIGSKEQLLADIHDRVMDEVMLSSDRAARAGGTPAERLAMLGDELLNIIVRYPDHVWVFLHEFPALRGDRSKQFRQRRHEYERRVEAVLKEGIEAGDFREVDTREATLAWLGMHNYTYLWLKANGRLSATETASFFADIFVRGISKS